MPDLILHTEGVTKCFGGLTAVNNITLDVQEGKNNVFELHLRVLRTDEGEDPF